MRKAAWAALFIQTIAGVNAAATAPEAESGAGRLQTFLQHQHVTGALRLDYFRSSRLLDDDTNFTGATAQVKVLPSLSDTLQGKVEARVTRSDFHSFDPEDRLLEGYATLRFAKADLYLGKQIVPWGRADGINPTDNLTPRDLVVLLPFEEDQRFGTTGLKLDTYLREGLTLTIFTTPFFQPSRIPQTNVQAEIIETRPGHTVADSEIAFKLDRTGGGLDWSLSYFHGYSLLPDARLLGSGPAGPRLELHYDRIDVVGGDIARNFGRYGFRGEAAYFFTEDKPGEDPGVKNPFLFYVVGVDRTFFENLNINLQAFGRVIRNFHDPESVADPPARAVAIQNAVVDGQQDRTSYGFSTRISDKWWNETLEAELLMVANVTRHNSYIRPLIRYAFNDHVKGAVGGDIYRGAEHTFFGELKRNRSVFAELRYSF